VCVLANGNDAVACACLAPVCGQLCTFNLTLSEMREWVANFDVDAASSMEKNFRDETSNALLALARFVVSKHRLN